MLLYLPNGVIGNQQNNQTAQTAVPSTLYPDRSVSSGMTFTEQLQAAGVVGAGGAGFPTHIKANSKADTFLVNGAECEPLIHKDFELMVHFPGPIVRGAYRMMESVGASRGFFCIKSKNKAAIDAIRKELPDDRMTIFELGDFYPSGDEYEIVYAATGRLIPPGGIPLQVGCVVNNTESCFQAGMAAEGKSVTQKFLCVTGAVKEPFSAWVPIGTDFGSLIRMAGGPTVSDWGVFVGGVMMGSLTFDLTEVVTKTTAGLIVLPRSHRLIERKSLPDKVKHKIGQSACDQCSYCTDYCPRYLLGYQVLPHKVMRSLGFTGSEDNRWNAYADLCCACGLCTLYACPEDLFPKEACDQSKAANRQSGFKFQQPTAPEVHPMKEGRRVPLKRLIKRLGLEEFDHHTPLKTWNQPAGSVKILLKQHAGIPAEAVVKSGQKVRAGDLLASPPAGQLGAGIHASISGTVGEINAKWLIINPA